MPPCSKVNSNISNGAWILPILNSRHHHIDPGLRFCLGNIEYPIILNCNDSITRNDHDTGKIKAWHIQDSIRFRAPSFAWHKLVWHRLKIVRYAHLKWQVCLDRLPTLSRLLSFEMVLDMTCFLSINRLKDLEHLFFNCHYSHHVLVALMNKLHTQVTGDSWLEGLNTQGTNTNPRHRFLVFLAAYIFDYHIWRDKKCEIAFEGQFWP